MGNADSTDKDSPPTELASCWVHADNMAEPSELLRCKQEACRSKQQLLSSVKLLQGRAKLQLRGQRKRQASEVAWQSNPSQIWKALLQVDCLLETPVRSGLRNTGQWQELCAKGGFAWRLPRRCAGLQS